MQCFVLVQDADSQGEHPGGEPAKQELRHGDQGQGRHEGLGFRERGSTGPGLFLEVCQGGRQGFFKSFLEGFFLGGVGFLGLRGFIGFLISRRWRG